MPKSVKHLHSCRKILNCFCSYKTQLSASNSSNRHSARTFNWTFGIQIQNRIAQITVEAPLQQHKHFISYPRNPSNLGLFGHITKINRFGEFTKSFFIPQYSEECKVKLQISESKIIFIKLNFYSKIIDFRLAKWNFLLHFWLLNFF